MTLESAVFSISKEAFLLKAAPVLGHCLVKGSHPSPLIQAVRNFIRKINQSGQAHKLLLVNLCWLFQLPSGPLSAWQTSCWVLQLFLYYLSLHQLHTFFLPQILPSFFKVAHICRITFVFLYDPWGEVLAQINQLSNFATKQMYLAF